MHTRLYSIQNYKAKYGLTDILLHLRCTCSDPSLVVRQSVVYKGNIATCVYGGS